MQIANITMFHYSDPNGPAFPADVDRGFCEKVREIFTPDIELAWTGFDCGDLEPGEIGDRLNKVVIDRLESPGQREKISLVSAAVEYRRRPNGHDIINFLQRDGKNWMLGDAQASALLCVRYRIVRVSTLPEESCAAEASSIPVTQNDFWHTLIR